MANILADRSWKMEVVDGWHVKREATEVLLVPPDGGPCVSISSPRIDRILSVEDLLYLNREKMQNGHVPTRVRMGDFAGLAFEDTQDGISWLYWSLICGNVWLEIGYDYSLSKHIDNLAHVEAMLKTLRVDEDEL